MPEVKMDAADVITAAATSPLGILALLCLIVAFLAHTFFSKARERTRTIIFLIIFAIIVFAAAIGFAASAAPDVEPEKPPELSPIEKAQALLPVEQEIYATQKMNGGEVSIDKVEKIALGFKISGYFTPDEFDEKELIVPNLENYDPKKIPIPEMKRIYSVWACRNPDLRPLLDKGEEGRIAIRMIGLGFGIVDMIKCPESTPQSSKPSDKAG